MGSPLSPVMANLFMEEFEKKALATATLKPGFWFRYVDDTFSLGPVYEFVCISFRTDNLNCFRVS
jgi:hypothetical protein